MSRRPSIPPTRSESPAAAETGAVRAEIEQLSRRELEVAHAYADGATYRAIAERLGIAPTTVRAHIYAVYRKLGVGSKIALSQALGGTAAHSASGAGGAASRITKAVRPSVAILPFENRSGAAEHEGVIAGIVDRTTGILSNFRMLLVIAAASSLTYRGSAKDITTIGEELGARYLLRGTFFRDGARLRVTAELLDAPTRAHLWSKTYDGAWSDIFELQDDLACSIAQAIEPEIRVREFERARQGKRAIWMPGNCTVSPSMPSVAFPTEAIVSRARRPKGPYRRMKTSRHLTPFWPGSIFWRPQSGRHPIRRNP